MKRITVLLAEDHMVVREGLRNMLELETDFEVVGEAQDGRQAVTLAKKLRPDVVLMDIAMPLLNGLEATRQVLKALPATKVLMLSAHSDDAYITNAMESGATGYLLKQTSGHDVCRAIREVQKGKTFFSASISRHRDRINRLNPPPLGSAGRLNHKAPLLTGSPIRHSHCLERFQSLLERMRVGVPVRLLESVLVEVPTLIGWLRPTILMPASVLVGLTPDQLEAILAHELAHVRRYDYLVNLFQTVIETILFYHPAVWWISRKLREERENCCDDIALEVMQDRLVYASALAQLEEGRLLPLALTASGGSLLQRIRRIAGANDREVSAWPLWVLIIAVLSIACLTKAKAAATTAISTSQLVAETPEKNPAVMIRLNLKVVQIDDDDYQAHRTEIDAAVLQGDAQPIARLKSYHPVMENPVLTKAGEQSVIECVRVMPYPAAPGKDSNGKTLPTEYKKRNLGVRFISVPSFSDGKINVAGHLEVTRLSGWITQGGNYHEPFFNETLATISDTFILGQTRGYAASNGAPVAYSDPNFFFTPDTPPPIPRKILRWRADSSSF